MSDELRKAVGICLQTARAAKMGLTMDQLRTQKIRPGQKLTAEQLAQVNGWTTSPNQPGRPSPKVTGSRSND